MTTSEKAQKALLGGIERYLGNDHPDLIPLLPKILMALYQLDVIEEEVVTTWGTHVSKKYVDKDVSKKVRKAAEPFLKVSREAIVYWGAGVDADDRFHGLHRSGSRRLRSLERRSPMTSSRGRADLDRKHIYLCMVLAVTISHVMLCTFYSAML